MVKVGKTFPQAWFCNSILFTTFMLINQKSIKWKREEVKELEQGEKQQPMN